MVYGPGYGPVYPAMIIEDSNKCGLCCNQRNYDDWLCGSCRARMDNRRFERRNSMERIGKPHDHGLPEQVEADPDLEALRCAAELVGRALEKVGSTEIDRVHEVVISWLSAADAELRRQIEQLEAREENDDVQE